MKAELKPYPAYKAAESPWLSEMPVGWEAIQLARLNTKLTNGFVGPTRDILREEGVRYLQSLHIKGGRIIFDTPYFVSEEWSAAHKKSVLKMGDVLIVQTGDIGQVAAVTDEFAGCNCHALIIVCAKPKMIDGFFLSAVLRSHYGFHSLKQVQTGALHPHLNCTYIRDIFLPVPTLDEQRDILAFLARETAKIDRLMEVRRKQVEGLQEQRTAVIHHAVTKGLEPNAKMKPSGVEWLGNVPEQWEVKATKWALQSKATSHAVIKNTAANTEEENLFPAFSASGQDVWLPVAMFEGKGIVLSAVGARCGKTFRADGKWSVVANTHVLFPRREQDRDFWWYVTNLDNWWDLSGSAQPFVQVARTLNKPWPVPPHADQLAIVAHINRETAKLDTLVAKYNRELELLAEYRASLISHAVTGKIDVRGLVPPPRSESP